MSTTNLDVIQRAHRQINVIPEGVDVSAEQAELGLAVMNAMLEEWAADGIDVGQWPQKELDADFPGSESVVQTVCANLSVLLAPHYEREAPPTVAILANNGYKRLERDAMNAALQPADMSHLPRASADEVLE